MNYKNLSLHRNQNLIFFHPHTQTQNLGDVIINKNLLDILRKFGDVIVENRKTPSTFLDEIGVLESEYYTHYYSGQFFIYLIIEVIWHRLRGKKKNFYLFFSPGHFDRSNPKSVKKVLSINKLIYFSLMRLLGVRLCRLGISIGDFTPWNRLFAILNSHMMFFQGIRDNFSKQHAQLIGFKNIGEFPDLAWIKENRTFKYVSNDSSNSKPDRLVFSFRDSVRFADVKYDLKDRLLPILDELVEKLCKQMGMKLILCHQVDFDRRFMKKLEDRYKNDISQITHIDERLKEDQVANIYSKDSVVVTNRLHVFLFAALCGIVPISLIDSKAQMKITGILKDAEIDECLIDIDLESDQNFSSRFESIIENKSQIIQKISLLHNQYHRQSLEVLNNTIFD